MSRARGALVVVALALLACRKTPAPDAPSAIDAGAATPPPLADTPCPTDLQASVGKPCAPEGKACAPSGRFTHLIMCSRGTWTEMEAPPPPPPPSAR